MAEARNLRNMIQAQTPLLGQENTPLHTTDTNGTGFEGATPRHSVAFTPNPLATPLRRPSSGASEPSATPRSEVGSVRGGAVGATPLRDNLSLNAGESVYSVGDTPRESKLRQNAAKHALRSGFSSLPKPLNDFEVELPEDESVEDGGEGTIMSLEDAAERDARIRRHKEAEERRALARRSSVVQQDLPRPANVDAAAILRQLQSEDQDEVQKQIDVEFVRLLEHDSIAHPIPGTSRPGSTQSTYVQPDDDALAIVRAEVQAELARSLGFPEQQAQNMTADQIKQGVLLAVKEEDVDFDKYGWANIRQGLAYDAQRRAWIEKESLTEEQRVAGLAALLAEERQLMSKHAAAAAKIEKKTTIMLAGYQKRSEALLGRLKKAFKEIHDQSVDLASFEKLSINEQAAGPRRIAALEEEVAHLETRERSLQRRYAELEEEKREISARMSEKEERLMDQAMAENEEALAAMDE